MHDLGHGPFSHAFESELVPRLLPEGQHWCARCMPRAAATLAAGQARRASWAHPPGHAAPADRAAPAAPAVLQGARGDELRPLRPHLRSLPGGTLRLAGRPCKHALCCLALPRSARPPRHAWPHESGGASSCAPHCSICAGGSLPGRAAASEGSDSGGPGDRAGGVPCPAVPAAPPAVAASIGWAAPGCWGLSRRAHQCHLPIRPTNRCLQADWGGREWQLDIVANKRNGWV